MSFDESDQRYRQELNAFITSPLSRMLINADEEWESRNKQDSGGLAGFKLQNGQVVKNFITIWELFDHRREFHKCIEQLTEKAIEIRQRSHFSKIITATPTAKELSEYLFDALRKRIPEQEFTVSHFGNYPKAALPQNSSLNFKDERVLILTDVINSGYLINTMAEAVEKNGGKVAAILSAIITNQEWINRQKQQNEPVVLKFGRSEARLYNLADVVITPLNPTEYDESKIIPIDYGSVLPEKRSVSSTHYAPAFSIEKMFEHIEEAEAVDFGFYELSDARLTSAFVLPKLLERYKQDIWHHIRGPIVKAARRSEKQREDHNPKAGELLLVTTYNRKDLIFKDFIEDCLNEEGYQTTTAITLKRGLTDTPYLNLTLGAGGMDVKGKEVVLALATLSTQEKLRNVVSLLVDGQVKKIIVLCLLNRLGPFTTNFIRAIERFTKRVTVGESTTSRAPSTGFSFSMVYSLLDLRDVDLSTIGNELELLFSEFRAQTKVPSFIRLCDRIEGYFHSKSYIERAYVQSPYEHLKEPYLLKIENKNGSQPIKVRTHEAKIALMTYNLSLNRDFKPIFEELTSTLDRRTFIHMYGLLLSDIHYLRFTGALQTLKNNLLERLSFLRKQRFAIEEDGRGKLSTTDIERLKDLINAEVYLILGLGIISHHESREHLKDLEESIVGLLFCDKTPEEWLQRYPICLEEYFSEERVFFVIAFLLHGLYADFHRSNVATPLKRNLDMAVDEAKKIFKSRFGTLSKIEKNLKATARLIMNNFDLIHTETGKHDNQWKHQIVRYLHREVLRPKEGHNPIFTNLRELLNTINKFIEISPSPNRRLVIDDELLLMKVDEALSATSSLHMIARSVRQLFFFTPTIQDQQERYTSQIGQAGFDNDINDLISKLNDIRQRRSCSIKDRDEISRLDTMLRSDFLDDTSHLRIVLKSYIVNLDEIIEKILYEANAQLNKEGFHDLLMPEYRKLRDKRAIGKDWPVLGELHLLREFFRNLFSNLRHAFPPGERKNLPVDAVQIEFEDVRYAPHPEKREKSGIEFRMRVKGQAPTREDFQRLESTIGDQLLRIQELGGDWDLIVADGREEFTFTLKLLTRYGYLRKMNGTINSDQIEKERELDDEP